MATLGPVHSAVRAAIRGTAAVLMTLAATVAASPSHASDGEALEYAVKAAYLYKFGGFIDWPASAFASAESPITVCVVGEDPFDGILDKTVEGQRIGSRPIAVHRLKAVSRDASCKILYVSGTDVRQVAQVLDAVRGTNVLTVTDTSHADEVAGIVNFVIQNNRVRFSIDDHAAAINGIVISSRLLSLALSVKPRS